MVSEAHPRQPGKPLVLAAAAGVWLLLATTLVLPQLHGAFHAPGALETDCPVHVLQVGFSLVLLGVASMPRPGICSRVLTVPVLVEGPRATPRTPLVPRAPPLLSFHSR